MEEYIIISIYIISMIATWICTYKHFKSKWRYDKSEASEVSLLLFISFIPFINTITSFLLITTYLIKKLKK